MHVDKCILLSLIQQTHVNEFHTHLKNKHHLTRLGDMSVFVLNAMHCIRFV